MPPDERIGFDIPQGIPPLEHSAQSRHHPARGIVGSSWFHLPFLKQRQLLPQEQILSSQRPMGPDCNSEQPAEGRAARLR
jgi:hypothetical protein